MSQSESRQRSIFRLRTWQTTPTMMHHKHHIDDGGWQTATMKTHGYTVFPDYLKAVGTRWRLSRRRPTDSYIAMVCQRLYTTTTTTEHDTLSSRCIKRSALQVGWPWRSINKRQWWSINQWTMEVLTTLRPWVTGWDMLQCVDCSRDHAIQDERCWFDLSRIIQMDGRNMNKPSMMRIDSCDCFSKDWVHQRGNALCWLDRLYRWRVDLSWAERPPSPTRTRNLPWTNAFHVYGMSMKQFTRIHIETGPLLFSPMNHPVDWYSEKLTRSYKSRNIWWNYILSSNFWRCELLRWEILTLRRESTQTSKKWTKQLPYRCTMKVGVHCRYFFGWTFSVVCCVIRSLSVGGRCEWSTQAVLEKSKWSW